MFAFYQTVIGFQLGYIFCYTNQITAAMNAKFDWDDHEATIHESIIGSSSTLTLMVAAGLTGTLIKSGRRRVLIWSAYIGIVGSLVCLYENFYVIILGKMIYGFSVGLIAIGMPRVMEETVPGAMVGFYGGLYCLSFAAATLLAYMMAIFLPSDTDTEALKETNMVQVVFGLPIVFYIIQLILHFTYFKQDTPKFLLLTDRKELAKLEIGMIYEGADTPSDTAKIAKLLLRSVQKQTSKV